jgi:hypothetical protein
VGVELALLVLIVALPLARPDRLPAGDRARDEERRGPRDADGGHHADRATLRGVHAPRAQGGGGSDRWCARWTSSTIHSWPTCATPPANHRGNQLGRTHHLRRDAAAALTWVLTADQDLLRVMKGAAPSPVIPPSSAASQPADHRRRSRCARAPACWSTWWRWASTLESWVSFSSILREPKGTVHDVVTTDGIVIARSAEAEDWIGRNGAQTEIHRRMLEIKQGTVRARGAQDADRLWGFTPVPGTDWYARSSVSANKVFGPVRERMVETGFLLAIVIGIASSRGGDDGGAPAAADAHDLDHRGARAPRAGAAVRAGGRPRGVRRAVSRAEPHDRHQRERDEDLRRFRGDGRLRRRDPAHRPQHAALRGRQQDLLQRAGRLHARGNARHDAVDLSARSAGPWSATTTR